MRKTKKKTNRPTALELAKQYVRMCEQINVPISRAILFGSQARGTAHGDSDIDLLLVSPKFTRDTLKNWQMLVPVTAKLFDVEPHPYREKNFRKGDPFLEEVMREGIEVVGDD